MVSGGESQDRVPTSSDWKQELREELLNELQGQIAEMRKILLEELMPPQKPEEQLAPALV